MNAFSSCLMAIGTVFVLTACEGGGGGGSSNNSPFSPQTAQGRFIDTVVEGMSYISGDTSGVTDSAGGFTYEVGNNIIFSVGTVELGTVSTGAEILTPLDITGSNSSDITTLNIVRFLLMLDSDGDSSNGISISSEVQSVAQTWLQVDFTATDLASELVQIISDISTADNRIPILPDIPTAQAHLEGTLACLSSGVFSGTFSGDDNGKFLLWVQHQRFDPATFGDNVPRIGVTSALVFSTDDDLVSGVVPQQGLTFGSDKQFISGLVSTGAEFTGNLEDYRIISNGVWQNGLTSESGIFSGSRLEGSINALYRLSGFFNLQNTLFSADGSGVIVLDIFADNSVTGTMMTLRGDITTLSGTVSGSLITISGGGNSFTLGFDADGTDSSNDALLGTTSGFIGTGDIAVGIVDIIGTSCQLN